jgi:hypothetical protein
MKFMQKTYLTLKLRLLHFTEPLYIYVQLIMPLQFAKWMEAKRAARRALFVEVQKCTVHAGELIEKQSS